MAPGSAKELAAGMKEVPAVGPQPGRHGNLLTEEPHQRLVKKGQLSGGKQTCFLIRAEKSVWQQMMHHFEAQIPTKEPLGKKRHEPTQVYDDEIISSK